MKTLFKGLDCCSARPQDCDICPYHGRFSDDDYPNCREKLLIDAMQFITDYKQLIGEQAEDKRIFPCKECKHGMLLDAFGDMDYICKKDHVTHMICKYGCNGGERKDQNGL